MKLESWLKHHSASKSKFNLEILHTLKDLHIAGLFFIWTNFFLSTVACYYSLFKLTYDYLYCVRKL